MPDTTHKNSLWKVLGLYAAGSWLVLQVVDVLTQNSGLPSWVFNLALILLIIGLPIVGATAYLHGLGGTMGSSSAEGTAEISSPGPTGAPRQLFTWRNALVGGVAALALWGLLVTGWLFFGPETGSVAAAGTAGETDSAASVATSPATPDLRSVAVLPFATRSSSEEDEYFSEGMHDDVLTQLSKIDSLTVISRTSVMQYAGTTKPIPEIASELGVATILEGGIQRSGDRVRVNVQLIEAATDRHLWAETYDEELTAANVFAIQSDLAKKIADALQASLTPETEARIEARPTESLEAFDLYTRARYLYYGSGSARRDRMESLRDLLQRAIEADSTYAQAWAMLGLVYAEMKDRAYLPADEGLRLAEAAVERSLELAPELSDGHSARSRLLSDQLRYEEAEAENLRALELNPGSAEEHRRYARLLLVLDRHEEAVSQARRAVELDPLSIVARATLADALWWAGDWEGTVAESYKVLEMSPDEAYAYYNAGYGHAMMGQTDEAIDAFRMARAADPSDPYNTAGLAWSFAKAGQRDSSLAVLAEVPPEGGLLKEIAIVYGELGDLDTAFEILDQAAEEYPGSIGQLRTDHSADPLKADPRYEALLRRVGLE
ncbi:MAG: tetratricopeptide repeat protein [marine benthic group bacterium]|jgi:TolB-like protein/Tfp pilus assembly protein PilF|nr:tetratricopeptide repeat protein [Gemmatimonadota bacterium]MCL7974402.1 tetratricopeptide repeat protein [Gemmatimonadota bacterium]